MRSSPGRASSSSASRASRAAATAAPAPGRSGRTTSVAKPSGGDPSAGQGSRSTGTAPSRRGGGAAGGGGGAGLAPGGAAGELAGERRDRGDLGPGARGAERHAARRGEHRGLVADRQHRGEADAEAA